MANLISEYLNFYRQDLKDSVVRFWLKNAPDHVNGGIFTCLEKDGSIYDTKKYIWHQARAAWTCCRLYRQFDSRQEYLEVAKSCLNFIERYSTDPDGRYYFGVRIDGKPYCYQAESYEPVFCMMAYLEYSVVKGDDNYFNKAVELYENIKESICFPEVLKSTLADQLNFSILADSMVLFDMACQLYDLTNEQKYCDDIAVYFEMAQKHYSEKFGALMEVVSRDGSDISDMSEGRHFSPGHSIEAAYFLLEAQKIAGKGLLSFDPIDVIKNTLQIGWDRKYGGLMNYIDVQGKPSLWLEGNTKLWWPQFEAIYAVVLAYKLTGDELWLSWLERLHKYVYQHFYDSENGGWFGFCDREGNLINTAKGSHSKGFFHVPRAMLKTIILYE